MTPTTPTIRLTHSQMQILDAQAQQAYPRECCGLLAGTRQGDGTLTVTRVIASANVLIGDDVRGGRDRFEIAPQVRFDLMRALKGTQELLVGHYHSHPDHPAEPSARDLDMAFEPDLVWLITPVAQNHDGQGRAGQTRAWRLNRETREIAALEIDVYRTAGEKD